MTFLHHPGNFTPGVPYGITVTAVFPEGLAPAPLIWGFGEELGESQARVGRRGWEWADLT